MMTYKEAIDRLRTRICCEKPIQHFCTDDCMYGIHECEVSIAIAALEQQIPTKVAIETDDDTTICYCPICGLEFYEKIGKRKIRRALLTGNPPYCYRCGQKLKWENDKPWLANEKDYE